MIYLFSAIVLLGVLIAIHEYGHFIVARLCNVHVYRFSIGMGPVVFKKLDKHGTEFALSALPLGGYVAMHTEKASEESAELLTSLNEEQLANTFESKPIWQRASIMLAGPVANFLLSICILSIIFSNSVERQFIPMVGGITSSYLLESDLQEGDTLASINGKKVLSVQDIRLELLSFSGSSGALELGILSAATELEYRIDVPVNNFLDSSESQASPENFLGFDLLVKLQPTIGGVLKDSPADLNGLKVNDRILSVNNKSIQSYEDLSAFISGYTGSSLDFEVQRGDRMVSLNMPLAVRTNAEGIEERYIGIIPGIQRSILSSIFKGVYETYNLSSKTLMFVGKMLVGDLGTQNLSGPIGIVQMAGDTAKAGFLPFLYLMALLSISLGVLNLLPIPVLDGGQLVMLGVEAARGSPMPERMENAFFMFGWVAVGSLMIFAIFNDISKFF